MQNVVMYISLYNPSLFVDILLLDLKLEDVEMMAGMGESHCVKVMHLLVIL